MSVDIAAKLVQLVKLSLKHLWILAIASGIVIFSPHGLLHKMRLATFASTYGTWVSLVFLLSTASILVGTVQWAWLARARSARQADYLAKRLTYVSRLSSQEKSVLREFFITGQNTMRLPVDHPAVAPLLNNGVLAQVGNICEGSLAGLLGLVCIARDLQDLLVSKIDLPCEPASDADREFVLTHRPDFLPEIEHHNQIFHTSWLR